jgi:hypothetical protein
MGDGEDERLLPGMTRLEIRKTLERRRLRELPPTESSHSATYLDICVREGPWLISIKRSMTLTILQDGTNTESKLFRTLEFKYSDTGIGAVAENNDSAR